MGLKESNQTKIKTDLTMMQHLSINVFNHINVINVHTPTTRDPLTNQLTRGRGKPLTFTINLAGFPSSTSTGSGFMSINGTVLTLGSSTVCSSSLAWL